jgi:recombination protein RecA
VGGLMAKRERVAVVKPKNSYFTSEKTNIQFVNTGCAILDCALGGGYPLGRTVNIVGDRSTAKTAMATEAMINFVNAYPDGDAVYRETEAAFDTNYAEAMGLPLDKINFGPEDEPLSTVEQFIRDFDVFLDTQLKKKRPGIYVLDSLDALSDDEEMENDVGKATYGMAKAKKLSIMFRKATRKQEQAKVLLLIISQVRDNIGAGLFGEKHKRSGGKALDFYASQVIFLAHLKTLKKTISKVERPIGIDIRAKIRKNKVGLPFREVDFSFLFGFGIANIEASLSWLREVGRLDTIDLKETEYKEYLKELSNLSDPEFHEETRKVTKALKSTWAEIEETFIPTRKKY